MTAREMSVAEDVRSAELAPEDGARADFYGLLSRLYAAAPDGTLLTMLAEATPLQPASEDDAGLALAWQALVEASRRSSPGAIECEYQDLFVGVGKSEVSLHAAFYVPASAGNVLAELRQVLADLGLGRKRGTSLYEDHLAAILETMRVLIVGTEPAGSYAFAAQHAFFLQHVATWVFACCVAIQNAPVANYYRHVAEFTSKFMVIERDSFAVG